MKQERRYNKNISEKVQALSTALEKAADADEFFACVTKFYHDYGVGKLGLNKAFRIAQAQQGEPELVPISNTEQITFADLIGYEDQKQRLLENTEAFVAGRPANNVLLFGDSGTGKSSSIKALINKYYDQGLRMIEIYKHQFSDLSQVIAQIKNRNYRFIIYMDDLSFEEFEIEYKYLKAIIEGGLEVRPDNILIYATSNRIHLINETWKDRNDVTQVTSRIRCRKSFLWSTASAVRFIMDSLRRRNTTKLSASWRKSRDWSLLTTSFVPKRGSGSCITVAFPDVRRSSLLIICRVLPILVKNSLRLLGGYVTLV